MTNVSELTLTIIRLGLLVVLWLFVLTAVSVMRSDLYGRPVRPGGGRRADAAARGMAAAQRRPAKPPKPRRGTPQTLVVTAGPLAGTTVRLGPSPLTIGRGADSTLVLEDDYVSSRHARLYPHDGQWVLEDLGSTNGTYLDRQKVAGPTAVPIGMPIRIGKTVVELRK